MRVHSPEVRRIAKGANVRAVECCVWKYKTVQKSTPLP